MSKRSISQRLLIEEVAHEANKLATTIRGLHIGELIKSVRNELGMSQQTLAKRAKVPQPTISKIEKGDSNITLSTLQKVCDALPCKLVIAPMLGEPVEAMRRKQARKVAKKLVGYLQGTMSLEDQEPDTRFLEALVNQEVENLLQGPSERLWAE